MLQRKMIQAKHQVFDITPNGIPLLHWLNAIQKYLLAKIMRLQQEQDMLYCTILLITNNEGPQLIFYPPWADIPVVNHDTLVKRYFILHIYKQGMKVA